MRTRDRGDEVQHRVKRLEAAVRRIDATAAELGTQLAVLRWRVDRIMDGTANALTEAAAWARRPDGDAPWALPGPAWPADPPDTR
jgi:hypothetical protein